MRRFEITLIISISTVLSVLVLLMFTALLMYEEPEKKEWCRDQFGTERPMEMCDD